MVATSMTIWAGATIIMSVADVQGAALVGPITPAAALTLGARLASAVTDGAFSPAGVRVDRDGEVHQGPSPLPPPLSARSRA